jgi:O-antigen ligase
MRLLSLYVKNQFIVIILTWFAALVAGIVLQQPIIWIIPLLLLFIQPLMNIVVHHTQYLFWLLICLLPLSTEWGVTSSLSLDFPDEAVMMIITGLFFFKWLLHPTVIPNHVYKHPLFLLLAIHIAWIAIACIYSQNILLSVKFLLAKSWFIIPFVLLPNILVHTQQQLKKLVLCLLIPMLFVVIQAIIRHAGYGFSFEGIKKMLSPFFRNHVDYSAMLVCIMPMAIAMWILTPKTNQLKKWLLASLIVMTIGLILSYSRGAWLAALIGLGMAFIIYKKLLWPSLTALGILLTVTTLSLVMQNKYLQFEPDYQHTIFHTNFEAHLKATIAMKDVSNAERIYRWVAGTNMVIEKPITGFGPNNFYNFYKGYANSGFKTWVSSNPEHSSVHNYFLLTALEQGVPGLLIFLCLYIAMLGYSQYLYIHLQSKFWAITALTTGVIIAMVGTLIFLSDLIETDKIGSIFWLCLGMLMLLSKQLKQEQQSIADSNTTGYIQNIA